MSASVKGKSDPAEMLDHLVNIDQFETAGAVETAAQSIATTLDRLTGKIKEQTITGKTNVGLLIWKRCLIAVAEDTSGKVTMPDVKLATIGKLSKLIGLSDDPGKRADGTFLPTSVDRFGYKLGTLGACVDLARGVVAGVDQDARADVLADDTHTDVDERNLRSAILARLNPNLKKNRAKGAESLAAAKIALATGVAAGSAVKVGTTVNSKGKAVGGKAVTVGAEKLNKIRNTMSGATLSGAECAAMTGAQIAANIVKLQLIAAARKVGAVKAIA